jgi:hypothetical protein
VFEKLTTLRVIQAFVLSYGLLVVFLLLILKKKVKEFNFIDLVRRKPRHRHSPMTGVAKNPFNKLGIIFQFSLSKDLVLGMIILSKSDFGLMAALASFWGVIRFIRPSSVIQAKLGETNSGIVAETSNKFLSFFKRASSAIYVQLLIIGMFGLVSYVMLPILLGKGFTPGVKIVLAGTIAEVLLMKCLYDLSIATSLTSQKLFLYLIGAQSVFLAILGLSKLTLTIDLIWFSSAATFLLWQVLNTALGNRLK